MVAAEEWESWERISWGTSSHEQQPPIDSLLRSPPIHPPHLSPISLQPPGRAKKDILKEGIRLEERA